MSEFVIQFLESHDVVFLDIQTERNYEITDCYMNYLTCIVRYQRKHIATNPDNDNIMCFQAGRRSRALPITREES